MVEELIPAGHRLLPIILNDDTQATILTFAGYSDAAMNKEVTDYAAALLKAVRDYLKVSINIGISNFTAIC